MPDPVRPATPGDPLHRLLDRLGPPPRREGWSADRLAGYFRPLVSRAVQANRGALAHWVARQLHDRPADGNRQRVVSELTSRLVQLFLAPSHSGRETVKEWRAEG